MRLCRRFVSMAAAGHAENETLLSRMADALPAAGYWLDVGHRLASPPRVSFVNVPGLASGL